LAYRKGLFDLIRAAALVAERYPKVKFLLAGDGPLERSLRSLTRRLDLSDTVTFLGHIDHDDPALIRLYQDCALYVQASRYEGLPGTLLEAMACGAPVVATAVSAHLDVIEPGENGLLAPAGSPQGLANAICTVLANSSLAERLGAAARLAIEQGYTWDHVTDRVLDGYNRVLTADNGGE
jgi:glycosyltransferase involved in cell wall biosynthesis